MNTEKRMILSYEILYSIKIGNKEIALAMDETNTDGEKYLTCFIERDELFEHYEQCLLSDDYAELERLMVETVTHPSQDGVGIAGPQVGLNRRVVAVQRFDKPGEPFEVYPNVRIVWASDSLSYGPEGCLSVPDRREDVLRSTEVMIEYADMELLRKSPGRKGLGRKGLGWNQEKIPTVTDTISGFTAVIFQHETDHLDGILYIDRVQ